MNEQEQQGMPPVPQPAESEQPAAPEQPVAPAQPTPEQPVAPAQPTPEQPVAEVPQPVPAPAEQPAPASVPPAWSAAGMPQPPVTPAPGTTQAAPGATQAAPGATQAAPGATQQASWQVPQSQPTPEQPPAYAQPPATGYAAPAQADMPTPVQPQKKSSAGLIVGGIVGALLVVVAVVLVAFVIPNLNSPSASTGDVTVDEPVEPDTPADDPAEPSVPADGDAETLVTAAAEAELDKLKNADPEALALVGDIVNEGFENQTGETLETCGVDPEGYARIMLENFSYTIDDVYVYESIDEATVYATVNCRDVFELIDNYNYMLEAYVNSEDYQYTTYEEGCQRMGMIFIEAAESAGMNGGYQMTIDLTYENGSWVIDEDQWESELDWLFDVE